MNQLLLFPETKEQILEKEFHKMKTQNDRVRKSQYAEITALKKKINELHHSLEVLTMAMCRCGVKPISF